jgi:predicted DCC family thiol-disulfide oxidoreductase YuxK
VLIFDGDCSFCTSTAHWIEKRLPDDVEVVAWQFVDDLGALGLTPEMGSAKAWWITPDGRRRGGHLAVGEALRAAGGFWGLVGRIMLVPPVSWIARPVYWVIAKNRHRMPGGTPACRIDTSN